MNIEILKQDIFSKNRVISGVTKRNLHLFPKTGLSVNKADILDNEEVIHHQMIFAEQLGVDINYMKCNRQVHGKNVAYMNRHSISGEADGIITDEKGIIIYVKIADCAGILLYDPVKEVIAALHSGWRGTMQKIALEGVKKLIEVFSVNPSDLLAYISPSASCQNYEVGWDVAQNFPNNIVETGNGKYLFDNKMEIFDQLISAGIKASSIEISDLCTIADKDYHSFRRDGIKSGRMAAFIGMKNYEI